MEYLHTAYSKVGYLESDCNGLCKISAVMGFMQDAATRHCDLMGFSRNMLMASHNAFWMIVRMHISLFQPIQTGTRLELQTWHRGSRGVLWYRDFDFFIDGHPAGRAATAWVIASAETRHIIRPTQLPDINAQAHPERTAGEELSRIRMPDLAPAGHRPVVYSDLDVNQHINNTKYADILCDALHMERYTDRYIADFRINFLEECVAGSALSLRTAADADQSTFYASADREDGKPCFESRLSLVALP